MLSRARISLVIVALLPACASSGPSSGSGPASAAGSSSGAVLAAAGGGLRSSQGPYELDVLIDGVPARSFLHRGETWVLGERGSRYTLRIANHSAARVEAVVSVDGLDVIDGKVADFRAKRGYLVQAWSSIEIDGWRISADEVAAFRFGGVGDSYAARSGNAREVGVVGVALFPEKERERPLHRPVLIRPERPGVEEHAAGAAPSPPHSSSSAEVQSAPAAKSGAASEPGIDRAESRRPGLGTEFGEAVASSVQETEMVRADADHPAAVVGLRYNDRDGLIAAGIMKVDDRRDDASLRRTADPFPGSRRD